MAITSAGVGSGLDLESIIRVSVDAENAPKEARFNEKESDITSHLSILGQVKSSIASLQSSVDTLKDISNFNKRTATVTQPTSDGPDIISVNPSSDATPGSFSVDVKQLAQGSRAVQDDAQAYSSVDDVVTASGGVMTFQAGSDSFDITLEAGATLADLREAINDSQDNFGVSANIINTGSISKLVLTSDKTGAGNDLSITADTAELDAVTTTAHGGGPGGMDIANNDQAQDAIIEVDGISINSATNVFEDAIQDITITALAQSPVDPDTKQNLTAQVNVDTDKDFIKSTIEGFVEAYNSSMDLLETVIDSKTVDATARGLKNALINKMGTVVSGANDLQTIYDIGISLENNNQLKISSDSVNTLDEALNSSYDDIGVLFASENGIGNILADTLDLFMESDGVIKKQENELNRQKRSLEDEREKHQYRMELYEEGLRQKYANLDVLIAGLRAQGSSITASLSNLPGFTKSTS